MSLLDWMVRRMRAAREQEQEMARREVRTRAETDRAHRAADRADRAVRELERLARDLR